MCNTCNGKGFIVVCIDDMCRGAGECFHGDGEIPCPECFGDDSDDALEWESYDDDEESR